MFGELVKKITGVLVAASFMVGSLGFTMPVHAATINSESAVPAYEEILSQDTDATLGTYVDVIQENLITTYGSSKPTGTSYVNIVNNNYEFDVTSMTVRVYTNSFFKGSEKVKVKVNAISVDKNGMQNTSKGITVHLRKKGASTDVTYSVPLDGASFYFTNLDTSALYYLEFTKQNDSQIYSFDGTISNAQ